MARENIHIRIPQPCHEPWAAMDSTAQGAFCHSCQKEVVDFTTMTDRELIRYLEQHTVSCGRLRPDQLDRTVSIPSVHNGTFRWRGLLLSLLPFIGAKSALALPAIKAPTDQGVVPRMEKKDTIQTCSDDSLIHISGKILDETGEGLIGAVVVLINDKGESTRQGAAADIDGNFSFQIKREMVTAHQKTLLVSYIGYNRKQIEITAALQQSFLIKMEEQDITVLGGMGFIVRKATPAQKIKYWFRRHFTRRMAHEI